MTTKQKAEVKAALDAAGALIEAQLGERIRYVIVLADPDRNSCQSVARRCACGCDDVNLLLAMKQVIEGFDAEPEGHDRMH